MPKVIKATTRKGRWKQQLDNYLKGRSSRPYVHTPSQSLPGPSSSSAGPSSSSAHPEPRPRLGSSSPEPDSELTSPEPSPIAPPDPPPLSPPPPTLPASVCSKCKPVLSRWVTTFQDLTHRGSVLKRRRQQTQYPSVLKYHHIGILNVKMK